MATTLTTRLGLKKQDLGDNPGAWHTDLNQGFDDADDRLFKEVAIGGTSDPNDNVAGNSEAADYVGQRLLDTTHFSWWTCKTAGASGVAEWWADIPVGMIWMFHGTTIPDGWALCDGGAITSKFGANAPDLKQKFIAGYDVGDLEYDGIGDTGGLESVALATGQQNSIQNHAAKDTSLNASGNLVDGGGGIPAASTSHKHTVSAYSHALNSDAAAHENRPPFYVLAFIIKL